MSLYSPQGEAFAGSCDQSQTGQKLQLNWTAVKTHVKMLNLGWEEEQIFSV